MKELSIEEKAKRYDEALKWMENVYPTLSHEQQMEAEVFFPIFKESEDERIRKDLIIYLRSILSNKKYGDKFIEGWIAWLEKQGQTFTKKDVDDAYLKGIYDAKQELEKQGEQKTADNVEPKFKVKYAGSEYNVFEIKDIAGVTYYGIEDEPNHIDYVLPDNCEIVFEQKSAWSEEDEYTLNETIQHLEELIRIDKTKHCACDVQYYQRDIDWLKSLRPQNTWKPSGFHLECISDAIAMYQERGINAIGLKEILEELKKLKEE